MSHLADLHEAGVLLAAGPLFDEKYRGLSILKVEPERARELDEQDPAVRAGLYSIMDGPRWSHVLLPRASPSLGRGGQWGLSERPHHPNGLAPGLGLQRVGPHDEPLEGRQRAPLRNRYLDEVGVGASPR
jgi:hypothetical protein